MVRYVAPGLLIIFFAFIFGACEKEEIQDPTVSLKITETNIMIASPGYILDATDPKAIGYNFDDVNDPNPDSLKSTHTYSEPGTYEVKVYYTNQTKHYHIEVYGPLQIDIPFAFTPNNDGINDTFQIEYEYINELLLKIFNNDHILMFETADPNGAWDGKFKGNNAETGTYTFELTCTDMLNTEYSYKGMIDLLR